MAGTQEIPLRGAGGEPVDFARTIVSHGVAELPPNRVDLVARTLETTLLVPPDARTVPDEDLSGFYELVREDDLAWCALGAGRMLRAPTVFEASSRRSARSYEAFLHESQPYRRE